MVMVLVRLINQESEKSRIKLRFVSNSLATTQSGKEITSAFFGFDFPFTQPEPTSCGQCVLGIVARGAGWFRLGLCESQTEPQTTLSLSSWHFETG